MQYYAFNLDAASQDLYIIMNPFGKYKSLNSNLDSISHLTLHKLLWKIAFDDADV